MRRLFFLPALSVVLAFQPVWTTLAFSQAPANEQADARLAPVDMILARVTSGRASLSDIKSGLKIGKPGDTANILHALYAMRGSPIIQKLLHSLWYEKRELHPDIPWERLQSPVARVALASTLSRIFPTSNREFLDYIRRQKDHEVFLVRSQVAVALGMNGDPQDIATLAGYVMGKSDHVAKSAVTGLAFMYNSEARQELIHLLALQRGHDERRRLIQQALLHTYDWVDSQAEDR